MVKIHFKNLHIDSVTNSSGVFSGKNQQYKWMATGKQNHGFGQITGNDNRSVDHIHTVIHSDHKDLEKDAGS